MKERKNTSSQKNLELSKLVETQEGFWIKILEDNSPIWGLIINNALKTANDEKVASNRFIKLSLLDENNKEERLAYGIWDLDCATTIAQRHSTNWDFSLIEHNNETNITFDCNNNVFNYLIESQVFKKDEEDGRANKHYMSYPKFIGEERSLIDIDIYHSESCRKDCVKLNIQIRTNK